MWVPSLSFALGSVQCPPQERPGAIRVAGGENARTPFATAGNWLASNARGSRCAGHRKSRRRWSAESGLVVCHVWMGEADSVGGSSTQHQKDCLDMWYSFLQSIT